MAGLARRSGVVMAAAAGLIVVVGVALATTPEASFTHSPATPLVGEAVTFTPSASDAADGDTIAQVEWDFEADGTYDAVSAPVDASVQHAYQAAGTYTVRMRVTDSSAESTEVTRDVTVNAAPTASFGFSPQVPLVGEPAAFDASASSDPEGAIADADHDWELDGDDDFDDAQGKQISHAFASAGPKTVKLRVTDAHGATDVETKTVTVNRAPQANFIFEPQTPKPGQQVEFASTSSDPDGNDTLAAYEWDLDQDGQFDDGSGPNATWTYPQVGTKTVKLRVRDGGGATSVKQRQLTVAGNAQPVAAFRVSPGDPFAGDDVELTSISADPDGPIASQSWDLDDDDQFDDASGPVASREFSAAGQ